MIKCVTVLLAVFMAQALGSVLDIFEQEMEHEPRVAINCGYVPFHIDLKTGKWVSDKKGVAKCDTNKEDVKRYCQRTYPRLNISNIVEANEKVTIKNWCQEGITECTLEKRVVPYRCLVDEYEADALMVPKGCKFNHLHDQASCMTHDEWKGRASAFCRKDSHKLHEYGILLSCGTDMFTGVEFVCCPKDHKKKHHHKKRPVVKTKQPEIDRIGFEAAVKEIEKYLPSETQGCDRTMYEKKRQKLEEGHRSKIAAVVDEWDEAEARYKKMKTQDPKGAQEKMKKTLQVFRETLAALEQEAKDERNRLKTEHAACIQTNINKQKRESLLSYLLAVQEKPHSIKHILRTARKFFQHCEHDRLHSLRHFQHVRKHNPAVSEKLRKDLLTHLQTLNEVVNKSITLLSFLPDVAEQFGLTAKVELPATQVPRIVLSKAPKHKDIPKRILNLVHKLKTEHVKTEPEKVVEGYLEPEHEELKPIEEEEDEKPVTEEKPEISEEFEEEKPEKGEHHLTPAVKKTERPRHEEHHIPSLFEKLKKFRHNQELSKDKEIEKKVKKLVKPKIVATEMPEDHEEKEKDYIKPVLKVLKENSSKRKLAKGTLRPTDLPPKSPQQNPGGQSFFKHPRSPAAFAAVIGLSCGALVIMLGIIVALVMRRNRANVTRVLVPDAEPEDQEHLVKMQKSGYENPTYKFFYY